MTEAEWLACADPEPMLAFLRGKVSDRKMRLFAAACCRRIWHLLDDRIHCRAVERAEDYADGLISKGAMLNASLDSEAMADQWNPCTAAMRATFAAIWASHLPNPSCPGYGEPVDVARMTSYHAVMATADRPGEEQIAHAGLLREIVGQHFHPVTLDAAWQTPTVTAVAQSIHDDRAFDCLPILADALEDAGCTDRAILDHCRQPGEHVLGCWVVDLVLGKS